MNLKLQGQSQSYETNRNLDIFALGFPYKSVFLVYINIVCDLMTLYNTIFQQCVIFIYFMKRTVLMCVVSELLFFILMLYIKSKEVRKVQ